MESNKIQGFRLSPQQERICSLGPEKGAFRAQCGISLEGRLDVALLKKCIKKLVGRHEILRTTYARRPSIDAPIQVVSEDPPLVQREVDLSSEEPSGQETAVSRLLRQERDDPFNLERGPVSRWLLVKLSAERHFLAVTLPSISADRWTLMNLAGELRLLYEENSLDDDSRPEPMQYIDYSEWRDELLEGQGGETGFPFWRDQETASYPEHSLPFEIQGELEADFEPVVASRSTLGPDLVRLIEAAAVTLGTSVPVFLLACWQTLLYRIIRQNDIAVWQVFDGRSYEELHDTAGLLATSLPVRGRFQNGQEFSEIVKQLDRAVSSASRWQNYFTPELAGRIDSEPSIAFEYGQMPGRAVGAGVSFEVMDTYFCSETSKIKLFVIAQDDSLTVEIHCDSRIVAARDAGPLLSRFESVVRSAAENPRASIDTIEIITAAERDRLLNDFNEAQPAHWLEKCVHHLFEQQVEAVPENVALVFEDQEWTYRELNALVNPLAHHLRGLGAGPDIPIAVLLDRSADMIVALLGVLKSGAAYVPLDPAQPKERLQAMLDDLRPAAIITRKSLAGGFDAKGAQVVCVDSDADVIAGNPKENPVTAVSASNLVYVIYTSGSTGNPKGVAVEHRQLLSYLHGVQEKLDLPAGAAYCLLSTFAADLGNTVIFPSLATGGCLHVISANLASDPEALSYYFASHDIDCLKIVPGHLKALQGSYPERIMPRKRLVLGGEGSRRDWIDLLQEVAPECEIINHYGPTETTVGVLTFSVTGSAHRRSTSVPLGRPIANARVYVLNEELKAEPAWVAGEIHIGGGSVARGYLNRPDLTAERFLPDPYGKESGARMYRTGDLARHSGSGDLEFLGRIDNQIKIRGFRVELGEIESAVSRHPNVRECAVITDDDGSGEKRLIAYVAAASEPAATPGELREFVAQTLPEYMVPSTFVTIDALPLTANGKVDRKGLRPPDRVRQSGYGAYVAPSTALEEVVAGIWAEVLGIERVGVKDNFFELGGHSLLVIQVISRVRDMFQIELPPSAMFENATVENLSRIIVAEEELPGQSERIAQIVKSLEGMSEESAATELQNRRLNESTQAATR